VGESCATGVGGGVGRGFGIGRCAGFLTTIDLDAGGGGGWGCIVAAVDEAIAGGDVEEDAMLLPPGRGAIGIATSPVLLYAGYPSQVLPERTHLLHCGLVSSHLTLRFLQLLQPVLTLGRLALLDLTFAPLFLSSGFGISRFCPVSRHSSVAVVCALLPDLYLDLKLENLAKLLY